MNPETLWKIKYHADTLNIILPFIFFFVGVYPLLEKSPPKEERDKFIHSMYFKVEFLAAIGLIATLSLYIINFLASSPLYSVGQCLKLSEPHTLSQFYNVQKEKNLPFKIMAEGDDYYLVKNKNNYYYELKITKDYRYKKTKCF